MPRLSRADAQLVVETLAELLQSDADRPNAFTLQALTQRLSHRLMQSDDTCVRAGGSHKATSSACVKGKRTSKALAKYTASTLTTNFNT
jgi:hypothetical protein